MVFAWRAEHVGNPIAGDIVKLFPWLKSIAHEVGAVTQYFRKRKTVRAHWGEKSSEAVDSNALPRRLDLVRARNTRMCPQHGSLATFVYNNPVLRLSALPRRAAAWSGLNFTTWRASRRRTGVGRSCFSFLLLFIFGYSR